MKGEVALGDVLGARVAEFAGRAINGIGGAFEFDEGANRSFVELDEEFPGPGLPWRKLKGGAEFFVAKPAAQAEGFEDAASRDGIGNFGFDFFAGLVARIWARRSGRGMRGSRGNWRGGFCGSLGGEDGACR